MPDDLPRRREGVDEVLLGSRYVRPEGEQYARALEDSTALGRFAREISPLRVVPRAYQYAMEGLDDAKAARARGDWLEGVLGVPLALYEGPRNALVRDPVLAATGNLRRATEAANAADLAGGYVGLTKSALKSAARGMTDGAARTAGRTVGYPTLGYFAVGSLEEDALPDADGRETARARYKAFGDLPARETFTSAYGSLPASGFASGGAVFDSAENLRDFLPGYEDGGEVGDDLDDILAGLAEEHFDDIPETPAASETSFEDNSAEAPVDEDTLDEVIGWLSEQGRNGDDLIAHINRREAAILKALGGAGSRNPDTGLPEFYDDDDDDDDDDDGDPGGEPGGEPGGDPGGEPGGEPGGDPGGEPGGEPGEGDPDGPEGDPASDPADDPTNDPVSSLSPDDNAFSALASLANDAISELNATSAWSDENNLDAPQAQSNPFGNEPVSLSDVDFDKDISNWVTSYSSVMSGVPMGGAPLSTDNLTDLDRGPASAFGPAELGFDPFSQDVTYDDQFGPGAPGRTTDSIRGDVSYDVASQSIGAPTQAEQAAQAAQAAAASTFGSLADLASLPSLDPAFVAAELAREEQRDQARDQQPAPETQTVGVQFDPLAVAGSFLPSTTFEAPVTELTIRGATPDPRDIAIDDLAPPITSEKLSDRAAPGWFVDGRAPTPSQINEAARIDAQQPQTVASNPLGNLAPAMTAAQIADYLSRTSTPETPVSLDYTQRADIPDYLGPTALTGIAAAPTWTSIGQPTTADPYASTPFSTPANRAAAPASERPSDVPFDARDLTINKSFDEQQVGPRSERARGEWSISDYVTPGRVLDAIPSLTIPGYGVANLGSRLLTGKSIGENVFERVGNTNPFFINDPNLREQMPNYVAPGVGGAEDRPSANAATTLSAAAQTTPTTPATTAGPVTSTSPYTYTPNLWRRYIPLASDPRRYGYGGSHVFFEDNRVPI